MTNEELLIEIKKENKRLLEAVIAEVQRCGYRESPSARYTREQEERDAESYNIPSGW